MKCDKCNNWKQDKNIEFIGFCKVHQKTKSKFENCDKYEMPNANAFMDLFNTITGANNE